MTAPLTPEDRAALKALEQAATPAPWHRSGDGIIQTSHITRDVWTIPRSDEDLDLIIAARNALPALLSALEEARLAESCDAPDPVQGCDCRRCLRDAHQRAYRESAALRAEVERMRAGIEALRKKYSDLRDEDAGDYYAGQYSRADEIEDDLAALSGGEGER